MSSRIRATHHALYQARQRFPNEFNTTHPEDCARIIHEVQTALDHGRLSCNMPGWARRNGTKHRQDARHFARTRQQSHRYVWTRDQRRLYVIARGRRQTLVITTILPDSAKTEAAVA